MKGVDGVTPDGAPARRLGAAAQAHAAAAQGDGGAVPVPHELVVELEQLRAALRRRPVIELGKGVLMALHRCDESEAFERMRRTSQHENVKVHDLAVALLARLGDERADDVPQPHALEVVDRVWGPLLRR